MLFMIQFYNYKMYTHYLLSCSNTHMHVSAKLKKQWTKSIISLKWQIMTLSYNILRWVITSKGQNKPEKQNTIEKNIKRI